MLIKLYRGIATSVFMLCTVTAAAAASSSAVDTLWVGPKHAYATPSEAALAANDGDVILITPVVYPGDVAVWRRHDLKIMGLGGRAHLRADGMHAEGKGTWVIKGNNTHIENIEFSGASVPDQNGAGIRLEGNGLYLRNCFFHDNENGLLAGENMASEIVIENSEFARNGYGEGMTHNIYVGRVASLTLLASYTHHARVGHNLKSRAAKTFVMYSRLMDEHDGNSSYIADFSNGGDVLMLGNVIQQGPNADNSYIISFGVEGLAHESNTFHFINNTVVNDRTAGTFLRTHPEAQVVRVVNNIFQGQGKVLEGFGQMVSNVVAPGGGFLGFFKDKPLLLDRAVYDYRLQEGSPAIDAGVDPGSFGEISLLPRFEYVSIARSRPRVQHGKIDIGAYEFRAEGTN